MDNSDMSVFGFRISSEILDELKSVAKKEHMPLSVLARRWLIDALQDYKNRGSCEE